MNFWKLAQLSMLALSQSACASRAGGSDSETHFVCAVDEECRSKLGDGYGCVASACEKVVSEVRNSCDGATCVASFPDAAADSRGFLTPEPRPAHDSGGCARMTFAVERIPHNVYVLLDESQAMSESMPGTTQSWWQAATDAILELSISAVAPQLAIQYFPLGSAPASCQARYDQPAVDFSQADNAPAIIASMGTQFAHGLSSPGPALKGGIDYLKALSVGRGSERWTVVLITKGAPVECTPVTMSGIAAFAADGVAASPSVRTYVIALDAGSQFDEVAAAGGTNQAFSIAGGGDVTQQIRDAFDAVLGFDATTACEITVPGNPPGGAPLDPSLIKVFYEVKGGVSMGTFRVAGPNDCAGFPRNGWYFDDPIAPTKILLCPELCAHPPSFDRYITIGCP